MKKFARSLALAALVGLALLQASAQGTVFVSNLNTPSAGAGSVASDSWIARSFITGAAHGGYVLESIRLQMSQASGTPAGFAVSIYPGNAGYPAFGPIGMLTGADPLNAGTHAFAASGILLDASRTYFIVVRAATPLASGAYRWSYGGGGFPTTTGGWSYGPYTSTSADSDSWTRDALAFQFSVSATAVPEPSAAVLASLGAALILVVHRRGR